MKINKGICLFLIVSLLVVFSVQQVCAAKDYVIGEHKVPVTKPDPASTYVGSEECKMCHSNEFDGWKTSGHPYKLNTPEEIQAFDSPTIPVLDGYTYDDIYLVIGGWGWKARFIGLDGYIITNTGANKDTAGSNQYNIATGDWVDYHPGEANLKFTCGNCHTTGYSEEGNQDNKAGLSGTWEEKSVGCEACHGPGSVHVEAGGGIGVGIIKDDSAAMCGACHTRGDDDTKIQSGGGFIKHHEQYPELLNSPHKELNCVSCHDPHKGTHLGQTNPTQGAGIIKTCEQCHSEQNTGFMGSVMQKAGVMCIDCHMPMVTKSAGVTAAPYKADTKTHLFKINTDPAAEMFNTEGNLANGYLTLGFACLGCHTDEDAEWAGMNVENIHELADHAEEEEHMETAMETPEAEEPEETPGFAFVFGIVSVLAAIVVRRR